MPGIRFQSRLDQYHDANGDPLVGGSLTFYESGTDDLVPVYLDIDLNDAGENPHTLDADGRQSADIFLDVEVDYYVVLKNAAGATIAEEDPTTGSSFASELAAHNADVNAHVTATTTNRGVVHELANDAEAQAQTDTQRVLTPSNLAAMGWTTTRTGLVEKATDAETEAGTDTDRGVTPANLQALQATAAEIFAAAAGEKHFMGPEAFAANITVSGSPPEASIKLPGGVTIKAGKRTKTDGADQSFTYGAAFATQTIAISITRICTNAMEPLMVSTVSAAGFTIDPDTEFAGPSDFFFIAIGN